MQGHGWTLLFHECFLEQLRVLEAAVARSRRNDPEGFEGNANVKLYRALVDLIQETIPQDPGRDEYRQGNTLGMSYRHWRRAKTGRRFRLFFRYDSKSKVIVYAWVVTKMRDESTLRSSGGKSDPYAVFEKMLAKGNPPDDWAALVAVCRAEEVPDASGDTS